MTKLYNIRFISLFIALQGAFSATQAQPLSLAHGESIGGTLATYQRASATDAQNNIYIVGEFYGTVDFDPGPGQQVKTANGDIFIEKLDPNGNLIWVKTLGTTTVEYARGIAIDDDMNVLVTGKFSNTVDFDPGVGIYNLTTISSQESAYLLKLDKNGNFVWARAFLTSTGASFGNDVVVDTAGNPVILGYHNGYLDMDPTIGKVYTSTKGSSDPFIVKLDKNGNYLWGKSYGGTGIDEGNSLAIDAHQNLYTCGNFQSTVDFDPGTGVFNLSAYGSGHDNAFIQKLRPDGSFVWAVMNTGEESLGYDITATQDGHIYAAGIFTNTIDLDPGTGSFSRTYKGAYDTYIQKLDTNGAFAWGYVIGGTNMDWVEDLCTDKHGNLYVTGNFQDSVDFDMGSGTDPHLSKGKRDVFICSLSSNGAYKWTAQMGFGKDDYGTTIMTDASNNLISTGMFTDSIDVAPWGKGKVLKASGSLDIYIAKYKDPTTSVSEIESSPEVGSVYPNPSHGVINVRLAGENNGTLIIYNVNGQLVHTQTMNQKNNVVILPEEPGLYIMMLQTKKGVQRFKVVKD